MPEMRRVESSWIAAIGYEADAEEVYVRVIEGRLYVYRGVPSAVWSAFASAESKGTFVNLVIKPHFPLKVS
jgi:hypothetical protein